MATKKKPALTPEAAKILEQYRNAGNRGTPGNSSAPGSENDSGSHVAKPSAPPPAAQHRSGTRGK